LDGSKIPAERFGVLLITTDLEFSKTLCSVVAEAVDDPLTVLRFMAVCW
jgi:hypothetical protein